MYKIDSLRRGELWIVVAITDNLYFWMYAGIDLIFQYMLNIIILVLLKVVKHPK